MWSLALRRASPSGREVDELSGLIEDGRAVLIGAIRQEVLSGVRSRRQFELLSDKLHHFVDLVLDSSDFLCAARFFNSCRRKGVQGSNTDFLICAAAHRHRVPIFTIDRDFERFADLLPVVLFG